MKIRKAFQMSLNEGCADLYEERHRSVWPELEQTLKDHGVSNYSIFISRDGRGLFAYAEVESEEQWDAIASTPICQRWWRYMAEIMPSRPDSSPVAAPLKEIYHLG